MLLKSFFRKHASLWLYIGRLSINMMSQTVFWGVGFSLLVDEIFLHNFVPYVEFYFCQTSASLLVFFSYGSVELCHNIILYTGWRQGNGFITTDWFSRFPESHLHWTHYYIQSILSCLQTPKVFYLFILFYFYNFIIFVAVVHVGLKWEMDQQ